ncbi:MAG: NAD(P)H-binding protein [Burkholderiaceae bacterium]|nr:NAD(P)H-binding protein [Burkholderiaceae bacterium]
MARHRQAPARVCVAGGTGLVGRAVLQRLAADPRIGSVTALVRRADAGLPPGCTAQVVDFATLGRPGGATLPPTDWAICCLGTTLGVAGSQAAFRAVDHDAVLAFARAAQAAGASRLGVVSALGADAASKVFYNRVKGEAEQALAALGLRHLVIVRPSLLLGERSALGQPGRPGERLAQSLMPAFGRLIPRRWRPIAADAVAAALLAALPAAQRGTTVLESDALQALAAER